MCLRYLSLKAVYRSASTIFYAEEEFYPAFSGATMKQISRFFVLQVFSHIGFFTGYLVGERENKLRNFH